MDVDPCAFNEPFMIGTVDADESYSGTACYVMKCDLCGAEWEEPRINPN